MNIDKEREAFEAWAKFCGRDTAHTYDTERSRWVFLNPMTADLWEAWNRRAALDRAPQQREPVGHLHSNGDFCQTAAVNTESWPVALASSPTEATQGAAAPASAEPSKLRTLLDVTLTLEETKHIAAFVGDDNEPDDDVVRLMVGDGHSGYGLYASHPEYPEEGAILVKAFAALVAAAERERCAQVCDAIEARYWALYKGRPPYTGKEPGRASDFVQGQSGGAWECAAAIREMT